MSRARTHANIHARTPCPDRPHDGRQWLNEKDREQDVPRYGRCGEWNGRSPVVAEDERGHARRQHDAGSDHGQRNRDDEGRCRGIGLLGCGRGAATVGFALRHLVMRRRIVRFAFVHRAASTRGTAGHAFLRCRRPAGAERGIPGDQAKAQEGGRQAVEQSHYLKDARLPLAMSTGSLVAKGDDRIDTCRASCGSVTGRQCRGHHDDRRQRHRVRIVRLRLEEERFDEA